MQPPTGLRSSVLFPSRLLRRQMLLDGISPEAELQADLDVGAPLSMELPSTMKVIAGEASPAARWLRGLAAGGTDGGLCDADLGSDMADRHARAGQIDDLLLLRRADRAAGHVADAAGFRDLAVLLDRRYAGRARFRSHLTRHEALAEGEQGYPVVWIDTAQGHHSIAIQTLTTGSEARYRVSHIGSVSGLVARSLEPGRIRSDC